MLITQDELSKLGQLVLAMLHSETTPTEFWLISDKIIYSMLNTSRMRSVPEDIKEQSVFNARVKLHANIRKFCPHRWSKARSDRGLKPAPNHDKGIYEFVCTVVRNNILKTITSTSKKASKAHGVQLFDMADPTTRIAIEAIDLEITKYWLDTKLTQQGVNTDDISD